MSREFEALVEGLADRLARPLPGESAHVTMAPSSRMEAGALLLVGKSGRSAAVLLLLFPRAEDGAASLVLTRRSAGLRDHSGQIAFPGGGIDSGETPEGAALREGEEEVGVPAAAPTVLGRLTPIWIPPTGFAVTPVVAAVEQAPAFRPEPREVDAVLTVSLADLRDPASRRSGLRTIHGQQLEVPFFAVAGEVVWGATAIMLSEFVAVLDELP